MGSDDASQDNTFVWEDLLQEMRSLPTHEPVTVFQFIDGEGAYHAKIPQDQLHHVVFSA